jgi:putative flippase GtrA
VRARHGLKQFVLFAGLGAVGTAGHYLTLVVLVELFQVGPVAASTAGFIVGAFSNYFLNYHFTFASSRRHAEAMSRFFTIAALGAGMNLIIIYAATGILYLHYLVAQAVATVLVLLWNFLLNKFWTFAAPSRGAL